MLPGEKCTAERHRLARSSLFVLRCSPGNIHSHHEDTHAHHPRTYRHFRTKSAGH